MNTETQLDDTDTDADATAPIPETAQTATYTIADGTEAGRADRVLAAHIRSFSRSQLRRLLDEGQVTFQGQVLDRKHKLVPGDVVIIHLPPSPPTAIVPADIPLEILFEDEHLLAVNKTSGIITHPGAGTGADTLVHAALHHTRGHLATGAGALRPGVVHRLDKETSGVILFAKTDATYHALVRQFVEREPDKQYIALVDKCPGLLSGSIRESIDRHPAHRIKMAVREDGKPAHTDWAVEERFGKQAARVRCWLHTGRTHQIRVHLSHIGHPLLGDNTYGKFYDTVHADWPMTRVMLHAARIALPHPITRVPLVITAPVPSDFLAAEVWLRERFGSQPVVKLS